MVKVLLALLISHSALAVPEAQLSDLWKNEVLAYYQSTPLETMTNAQNLSVAYRSFTNPSNKKVLVILPGRSEPAQKWAEVVYDLRLAGVDIHVLDHQGQGDSERLLADSQKGYVVKFGDYVNDFAQFMAQVVIPQSTNKELLLLAHSMGGAVASYYLSGHQNTFKAVILTAPMMEINTKPYSETVACAFSSFLVASGMGKKYAPGRGPYIPEKDLFEKNEVTHSQIRFDVTKRLFVDYPELVIGGPTSRWVRESLRATKNIDDLAKKITTPILLLQAKRDLIVKLPRQSAFCAKAPNCHLIEFPEAGHEIFMEKDATRDVAMNELLKLIKR